MRVRGAQGERDSGGAVGRSAVFVLYCLVLPTMLAVSLAAAQARDRYAGLTVLDLARERPRHAPRPRPAYVEVPVPAVTIYPGQIVAADMLRMRRLPVGRLATGFLTSPRQALGRMAARTLVRGRPIPASALQAPWVVRRGQAVHLVYATGALRITALGRALDNAAAGEVVAVRNVDSGRVVYGTARADGTVQVSEK